MLGSWKVNVVIDAMPQKVATAVGKLSETLIGAEYKPIAYLGSQVVNGINHAVLAEQTVLTGKDSKNIVVLTFNEKQGEIEATLVGIDTVLKSGDELGGIVVNATTDIPAEAKEALDKVLEGYVGAKIEPFAYLGSQVVKGVDYIFAATITPVVPDPVSTVAIVKANALTNTFNGTDLLQDKTNTAALGYAFTWLKYGDNLVGAPLGEWP